MKTFTFERPESIAAAAKAVADTPGAKFIAGGTNLPLEFLTQIDVNSGGYQAEYGGATHG